MFQLPHALTILNQQYHHRMRMDLEWISYKGGSYLDGPTVNFKFLQPEIGLAVGPSK